MVDKYIFGLLCDDQIFDLVCQGFYCEWFGYYVYVGVEMIVVDYCIFCVVGDEEDFQVGLIDLCGICYLLVVYVIGQVDIGDEKVDVDI